VGNAIEEMSRAVALQANMDRAGPDAPLKETVYGLLDFLFGGCVFIGKKMANGLTDDILKGLADEIGKTTIDSTNFAVEAKSQKDIVKRID
jgi:hypothetical protein